MQIKVRAAASVAALFLLVGVAVFSGVTPAAPRPVALAADPITITGVDSHDGTIYEDAGVYYWAGTRYGCGFQWNQPATPWCGFGVWSAPTPAGPWTYIRDLFNPAGTSAPAYHGETWQTVCRGDGCFNPRMLRRSDGAWLLWFNAPRDLRIHGGNQFWALGCNGPAGPCGLAAGPPYGSTTKPPLWICNTGGDFSILDDAGTWYLFCGTSFYTISVERLAWWGNGGTGVGANNLAGVSYVEGAGVFKSVASGRYVLTFGDNCPYCSGTDTSYAFATNPMGPYTPPAGGHGRRVISGHSCGGQPRTVTVLDDVAYQLVDHWYDAMNETNAATSLFPLVETGTLSAPAAGGKWAGGFQPFDCS